MLEVVLDWFKDVRSADVTKDEIVALTGNVVKLCRRLAEYERDRLIQDTESLAAKPKRLKLGKAPRPKPL